MKIKTETVIQHIYVSQDGRETPVTEMTPSHLVNALLKCEREGEGNYVEVLKKEIVRRLTLQHES